MILALALCLLPATAGAVDKIGVDLTGSGTYTPYDDFSKGWNIAVGAENTANTKVKLYANWDAVNGRFGTDDNVQTAGSSDPNGIVTAFDLYGGICVDYNKTVALDLGGYSINRGLSSTSTVKGSVISCLGNLTVSNGDATTVGQITGGYNGSSGGGGVYVEGGFILESGSITNNSVMAVDGGGVYIKSGYFTMNGGSITSNTTYASGDGGGVYIAGGNFNMNGGSITGNTAGSHGGGVSIGSTGKFYVNGSASINTNNVGGIANNVYLTDGKTISITGTLDSAAEIGVTAQTPPVAVASTTIEANLTHIKSDDDDYETVFEDSKIKLKAKPMHYQTGSDADIKKYTTLKKALAALSADGGTITVLGSNSSIGGAVSIGGDIKLERDTSAPDPAVITAISGDSITITDAGTLTLYSVILNGAGSGEHDVDATDGELVLSNKSRVGKILLGASKMVTVTADLVVDQNNPSTLCLGELVNYQIGRELLTGETGKGNTFKIDNMAYIIDDTGKLQPSPDAFVKLTRNNKDYYFYSRDELEAAWESGDVATIIKATNIEANLNILAGVTVKIPSGITVTVNADKTVSATGAGSNIVVEDGGEIKLMTGTQQIAPTDGGKLIVEAGGRVTIPKDDKRIAYIGGYTDDAFYALTDETVEVEVVNGSRMGVTIKGNVTLQPAKVGGVVIRNTELLQTGDEMTVAEGKTLTIAEGAALEVQAGATLLNNGTIEVNGSFKLGGVNSAGKVKLAAGKTIELLEFYYGGTGTTVISLDEYAADIQVLGGNTIAINDAYTKFTTASPYWKINDEGKLYRYTPPAPTVVSTPVIAPNGGEFITAQTVTITCATYGATVYYTTDGREPTTASAVYSEPFEAAASCVVKAKGVLGGLADSPVASATFIIGGGPLPPAPHDKPYVIDKDGNEVEYDTVQEALGHAAAGDTVVVPVVIELAGDLEVPAGVTLNTNNNVYTAPDNGGRLIVHKDGTFTTKSGESITVSPIAAPEAKSGASAHFASIEIDGVFANGGSLTLTNVKTTGDGRIDITSTGEVTLGGESALGKVKLAEGRAIALGLDFKAVDTAATIFLGDDYELGRSVLTFGGAQLGEFAKFFALGDAPDDSWYIDESGALSCKIDPEDKYLLLDKLVMGKGQKISANNLLPLNFKGGVVWQSDVPTVLKIAGKGQKKSLKPVAQGVANLTATFADGTSETIAVSVVPKKDAATVLNLKKKLNIRAGKTEQISANIKPGSALDKTLKWFTTDPAVATVDQTGLVTAVAKGKCKVYAITTAGARKAMAVNVKKAK